MNKLRIGYCSDLHIERLKPSLINRGNKEVSLEEFSELCGQAWEDAGADIICCCGDIGSGVNAVHFLQDAFKGKTVFFTCGNHEFWSGSGGGGEIHSTTRKIRDACKDSNVHFLNDASESIEIEIDGVNTGILITGATLWTDYLLNGNRSQEKQIQDSQNCMNDFHQITIQDSDEFAFREAIRDAQDKYVGMNDFKRIRIREHSSDHAYNRSEVPRRLKALDLLALHRQHRKNIENRMQEAYTAGKKLVVISHHAPSLQCLLYPGETATDHVFQRHDPCYASHLDGLFAEDRLDAPHFWFFGHTHIPFCALIGKTIVASNPKGYSVDGEVGFELGAVLEIPL